MSSASLNQQTRAELERGIRLHHSGQLVEAEDRYRRILRLDPAHSDALHLLGVVGQQTGRSDLAVEYISRAIAVDKKNPLYHCNLGAAHLSLGELAAAAAAFREALRLKPGYADASFNLGVVLEALNERDSARRCYQQAVAKKPELAEAHNNLGNILKADHQWDEAATCYRAALKHKPAWAGPWFNLATVLQHQNHLDEAVECYLKSLELAPEQPQAWSNLGLLQMSRGNVAAAVTAHRRAMSQRPDWVEARLYLGSALISAGELDEAALQLRRIGELAPEFARQSSAGATLPDTWQQLAQALIAENRSSEAIEILEEVSRQHPEQPQYWFNLSVAQRITGDTSGAIATLERTLALDPAHAAAHNNLASLYQTSKQLDIAVKHLRQALATNPDFAEAHYNLGNCLKDLGDLPGAAAAYREALRCQPDLASAHNNLGTVLQALGDLSGAAECFKKSLEVRPDSAPAHNNLGGIYQARGLLVEAESCYQRAVDLTPTYADALNNLGTLASVQDRWDDAARRFEQVLKIDPGHVDALTNLAMLRRSQGRVSEAADCLERALATRESSKLRLLKSTLLPPVYESADHLMACRESFYDHVWRLTKRGAILNPLRETVPNHFYLAYQGRNDCELMRDVARLIGHWSDEQNPKAEHLSLPPSQTSTTRPSSGRIRVGFLSRHLKSHTIGRFLHGLISGLSRLSIEVVVLSLGQPRDELAERIRRAGDRTVILPENLPRARQAVIDENLDVLFYPDLGMDTFTWTLAGTRLAPVQCVTWGHPVTTGLETIDYFLSSELIEPADGQSHYTETLVKLQSLPTCYERPKLPATMLGRAAFGLPEGAHLYGCPQSLFKFHPEFDELLGGILRADPAGEVVLLEGLYPHWTELLRRRFQKSLPDVIDRIRFIKHQPYAGFLNLLALFDVLLDPLHFGGGNSSFEALALNIPIVTLPGEFMRGRVTAGCYQRMGITDCIAVDKGDYITKAVQLASDADTQRRVRARISATSHLLFDDTAVIREIEQFLREAVGRASGQPVAGNPVDRIAPSTSADSKPLPAALANRQTYQKLAEVMRQCTCPACAHHISVPFFDGGYQPLATVAWPTSAGEAREMRKLPHSFLRCVECGHVYNSEFRYADVPYSEKPNLMFNKGTVWSDHLRHIRELILSRTGPSPVVVEVGCGEGHLLRGLAEARPAGTYIGFDPSGATNTDGGRIVSRRELFFPERHLAELRPDLIVSRHVFEHLTNPLGFVQSLAFAATWANVETQLLIEVPCIDQTIATGRLVDFFYEHTSHFTTTSLHRLLVRCASQVELLERGYNNEVVYGLARFRPRTESLTVATEALEFHRRASHSLTGLAADLAQLAASGQRVAIWGGTGKAAAFINQNELDPGRFNLVVDSDADKAGTFVPGMGQEIRFRDVLLSEPADVILIATQWRAHDIVLEITRHQIPYQTILLEHRGRLVDYFREDHPYGGH